MVWNSVALRFDFTSVGMSAGLELRVVLGLSYTTPPVPTVRQATKHQTYELTSIKLFSGSIKNRLPNRFFSLHPTPCIKRTANQDFKGRHLGEY